MGLLNITASAIKSGKIKKFIYSVAINISTTLFERIKKEANDNSITAASNFSAKWVSRRNRTYAFRVTI